MWFQQKREDRILHWRDWRKSLSGKDKHKVLQEIAKTWAQVPTGSQIIAQDSFDDWPNPWQLISDNYYCDLSVALGMCYSILLLDDYQDLYEDVSLNIYKQNNNWVNLPTINQGKYVLNWNVGEIVNIEHIAKNRNLQLTFLYSNIDLLNKIS